MGLCDTEGEPSLLDDIGGAEQKKIFTNKKNFVTLYFSKMAKKQWHCLTNK